MKVILNQTVPKVGKQGTVVTVADGFARNFLFPRGLAVVADKGQLRGLEIRNVRLASKSADVKVAAEALKESIDGKTVRIAGQVGKGQNKLFGAITSQNVADAIQTQLGVSLEKKNIALVEPIKRLGEHVVEIDLHREVDASVTVHVFDPEAEVEPVVAPEPTSVEESSESEAVEA